MDYEQHCAKPKVEITHLYKNTQTLKPENYEQQLIA